MPKPIKITPLGVATILFVAVIVSVTHAEIILDTAYPVEKQSTRIHVVADDGSPVDGAAVTVTYRPGSAVPAVIEAGRTAEDGNCDWIPREAGIVTISAVWTDGAGGEQTATVNASVKYNPTPIAGIVIMIAAGLVLIGGAIERIARLLSTAESN